VCQIIVFHPRATRAGIPVRNIITIREQQAARRLKELAARALETSRQVEAEFQQRLENGAYFECGGEITAEAE
jgi:antitoxin (DNA-binding transcriptional repressor) of toxin-antitoxin stability system